MIKTIESYKFIKQTILQISEGQGSFLLNCTIESLLKTLSALTINESNSHIAARVMQVFFLYPQYASCMENIVDQALQFTGKLQVKEAQMIA